LALRGVDADAPAAHKPEAIIRATTATTRLRLIGRAYAEQLTIALAAVLAKDAGIGSGIVNLSQHMSAVLSVAILGAVSTGRTASLLASGSSARPWILPPRANRSINRAPQVPKTRSKPDQRR